jgi:hypothetical protein
MNKTTYNKLLVTYLNNSIDNNAVNFIGFDNEYLNECGITDKYASNFDILTFKDLCKVFDYVVHGYNVSYRNNKTSGTEPRIVIPLSQNVSHILLSSIHQTGNHADFHQFVGSRPYVHYYHLWLIEIRHLSFPAVPQLSATVFRMSMADNSNEDGIDSSTSLTTSDEVLSIVSPPPAVLARRKLATSTSATPGQEARKMSLLKSHLKAVENIQYDAVAQRKSKDERDV